MENNKLYCIECSKNIQYHIKQKPVTITVKGVQITYTEKSAICNECGAEIYHPAINDANVNARGEAYLKAIVEINQKISINLEKVFEEQKKLEKDLLTVCEENLKLQEENKKLKEEYQGLLKDFFTQARKRSGVVYGDRAVCISVLEDIYKETEAKLK